MEPLGSKMERGSQSEVPTGLAFRRAAPLCVHKAGGGAGARPLSPDVHLVALPPGLFLPVTLAGQPGR